MLNINEHLISGELSGGDGRVANLFELNSNYQISCKRNNSGLDEFEVFIFNKSSQINHPVAASYFFSDEMGVRIDTDMYVHESLGSSSIEGQLFLLQSDLAFRIRNNLLEIPEGHDEDLPEVLYVTAGDSEDRADEVIEWLSNILVLEKSPSGIEKRQRSSVSHPEYDYEVDDMDNGWDVILRRNVINRIATICDKYIPESIKEGLYGQLSS